MTRLAPLAVLALALAACKEGPAGPDPAGDGPTTVPSELPVSMGGTNDGVIEGAAPGFIGATAPETAFLLDDGGVCYVYGGYIIHVEPIGTDGEPRGDLVRVAVREEGGIVRDLCQSASREVTSEDEADTFSGVEGDVLLLDRASGETGRRILAVDLANGDEVVLDSPYESEEIEIENGLIRFGALVREATSMAGLSNVSCEQGPEFIESGLTVGVVQMQTFDLKTHAMVADEALTCVPL